MERIVELDLGCVPNSAVSGPVLLQTDDATALVFNATKLSDDGSYKDAGSAVVRFERCKVTRFGYPNDEAWYGIPRFQGLSYGIYEVLNSSWLAELDELNRYSFPDTPDSDERHFLFLFHDSSFECIASDCAIELTHELWENLWPLVYQEVLRYVAK